MYSTSLNYCEPDTKGKPIYLVAKQEFEGWLSTQSPHWQNWLASITMSDAVTSVHYLPSEQGGLAAILKIYDAMSPKIEWLGGLAREIPEGDYQLNQPADEQVYLGWGLDGYRFERYKKQKRDSARLILPENQSAVLELVKATYLVRDLINTPTEDMHPGELVDAVRLLAKEYCADYREIVGDDLLAENFPGVHAVGRASVNAPRVAELTWGDKTAPLISLVGKGVCFDTGGLNIKVGNFMRDMKKDMGGAANMIGLARLIMQAKLPVCLQLLIPAVENSVSGNSIRPGDVLTMRNGKTVEIDNTDAEGRLILADCLSYACEQKPELLVDAATLTGAARVAVGTEMAAYFTDDASLANKIMQASEQQEDPCWQQPLYQPYRKLLDSTCADMVNSATSQYAGAITAGLFLKEFVQPGTKWCHFDIMAGNVSNRPARPEGGEAMGMRALFAMIKQGGV